ncbi:unnamed protein product [Cyprideis torosa]|uniref:Uncharacterized protein n=1 Tax=Cyprideis torosa TaxID=163714 RepID=A0A7R8ZFI3_9CRUS|nr:unnamed protein product [Cyprideis torosa]CAG0879187.1 unnamed protein product [Cyprideis torosa]
MASSVLVSVEAPQEYRIQEMTYDGTEILQPPYTMSENLARLASKVDFSLKEGESESDAKFQEQRESEHEPAFEPEPKQIRWPWENIRNRVAFALNECSVLLDVMKICKENKFMVLDSVQQAPVDKRPIVPFIAKKRHIAAAAHILMAGGDRLRNAQLEASENASGENPPNLLASQNSFDLQLLQLRHQWRLRKIGNVIVGDLSYKTVGSRYWQSGKFEVSKRTDSSEGEETLKVTIPPELDCQSFIHLLIRTDTTSDYKFGIDDNFGITLPANHPNPMNSFELKVDEQLSRAQTTLFCNELFAQLSREAIRLQSPIPHTVVGNTIDAILFPGVHLYICLARCPPPAPSVEGSNDPLRGDIYSVFEHSLHHMLYDSHYENLNLPAPHPTTAPIGLSKRRRLAGPEAHDVASLLQTTETETILERLLRMAKHWCLRQQSKNVIDEMAASCTDPVFIAHWNTLTHPWESSVRMNIYSAGYETSSRTAVVVHIEHNGLKVICRDGRVINLSYEPEHLWNFLELQVAQHQISAIHGLAKVMGWILLGSSYSSRTVGAGTDEIEGMKCLLMSPNGKVRVFMRCLSGGKFSVGIQSDCERLSSFLPLNPSSLNLSSQSPGSACASVNWDEMMGKNNVAKMEFLLTALSSSV